jgi:hypothetical protein
MKLHAPYIYDNEYHGASRKENELSESSNGGRGNSWNPPKLHVSKLNGEK